MTHVHVAELGALRARALAHGWRWSPRKRRERAERGLQQRFAELVRTHDLVPALSPRLDRHAYDYWLGDHAYDTAALRRTGYVHRHPDPRIGIAKTIEWYRRTKWLPPAPEDT